MGRFVIVRRDEDRRDTQPPVISVRRSSKPIMSPRWTSMTRQAVRARPPKSRSWRPDANVSTAKPADSTRRWSARRTDASSSTLDTRVAVSAGRAGIALNFRGRLGSAAMGLWWHASGNSVRSRESKGLGHPDQPGEGIGLHLLHDSRAVGFDRFLADPQLLGGWLVKPGGCDEVAELAIGCGDSGASSVG